MIEYEKKFLLSKDEYLKIINTLNIQNNSFTQQNHYYDTNDFELCKKGITCRIREKDKKFIATIKTHLADKSLEQSKQASDENDISLFSCFDVIYQGALTTHRTKIFYGDGYEIVLDKNQYLGIEDYELEAEYYNGNEEIIKSPLKLISSLISVDFDAFFARDKKSQSKSTRFFERKKDLLKFNKPKKTLETIVEFRHSDAFNVDKDNTNRFCIAVDESDGSKTGYYFSAPVYNAYTKKLIDNGFVKHGDGFIAEGSNSVIKILKSICLENEQGRCEIPLNKNISKATNDELTLDNDKIVRTTNGIVYKAVLSDENRFVFDLIVDKSSFTISSNDQNFVLLEDRFKPFISISCIGASDGYGQDLKPAYICYQKITDNNYRISVSPYDNRSKCLLFEINMYEQKSIQDTTVESVKPQKNNAYGGMAFIGNSEAYGEQWLYSKMDFYALREVSDKKINKAIWHLPKYNNNTCTELSAFSVLSRFCSFGSNWENKIGASNFIGFAVNNGEYIDIDITNILINVQKYGSVFSQGIILKPKFKNNGYIAVSTGDNYWKPQIIEINYT